MKMTRIKLVDTRDGDLFIMRPSAEARAALQSAPANEYLASYMQDQHVRLRRAMEANDSSDASWLSFCFDVPGRLDREAWQRTMTRWVRRHGVMHGTFREDANDPAAPLTRHDIDVADLTLDITAHGHHTGAQINDLLLDLFTEACVPVEEFGYVFAGIDGEDGATLFVAIDHCYGDGFSVFIAFAELVALYDAEVAGTELALPPVINFMDYAQDERARAAAIDIHHPAMSYWADYAMKGMGLKAGFPMDLGVPEGEKVWLVPGIHDLLTGEEAALLDVVAKEQEATFPALVYAALALATRDLAGQNAYRFLNPVASRKSAEEWPAMGWLVNVVPIHIDVADGEDLFTVARRVRGVFRDARVCEEVPALRVMEVVQEAFGFALDDTHRPSIVSFIDGRPIPSQELWLERRFHGATGEGYDDDVNVWINRMPDSLYVACSVPGTDVAEKNVEAYFRHASDRLREAIAHLS